MKNRVFKIILIFFLIAYLFVIVCTIYYVVKGLVEKSQETRKEIVFDCYDISFEEGNYSYWTNGGVLVFEKENETLYCSVKAKGDEK